MDNNKSKRTKAQDFLDRLTQSVSESSQTDVDELGHDVREDAEHQPDESPKDDMLDVTTIIHLVVDLIFTQLDDLSRRVENLEGSNNPGD